jgi:hypothetical protein
VGVQEVEHQEVVVLRGADGTSGVRVQVELVVSKDK